MNLRITLECNKRLAEAMEERKRCICRFMHGHLVCAARRSAMANALSYTGARKSEVLGIRRDQVDLHDGKIRLYDTKKHVEGRWLPIYGEMQIAIAIQVESLDQDYRDCEWLCHRNGNRIVDMRPAWPDACESVGLQGLMFHDLRRSAIRNMERAGISREVAKKISGAHGFRLPAIQHRLRR